MKAKPEIINEILTSEGLKAWEAHTDKFNRMVAEKAMDTHASQVAGAFAEWIDECGSYRNDDGLWADISNNKYITTSELFEKFKSEIK